MSHFSLQQNAIREPLDAVEAYRHDAVRLLDAKSRSKLGQYMTPASIASFMASLFEFDATLDVDLLDAGAGVGSLTSAVVDRICRQKRTAGRLTGTLYEIEPQFLPYLQETVRDCEKVCAQSGIAFKSTIVEEDFILDASRCVARDIWHEYPDRRNFSHAILNPPYKKIRSDSDHRKLLRSAGIETSNLYTAFLALSIHLLAPGGQLVAIVPRSFCNGPYFTPFRHLLLSQMTIRHLHVFESRSDAFKDDDVLQENIILHAVKDGRESTVSVTTSSGSDFADLTQIEREQHQIILRDDPARFIHIASNELDQHVIDRLSSFSSSLEDLGVSVSTGPVVDFRLKEHLYDQPNVDTVPLIYPGHFRNGFVHWPNLSGKKPNAILRNGETEKWLFPQGTYTLVRRFSAKEEDRRIVASVFEEGQSDGEVVGFENHINVFHAEKAGLDPVLANGLAVYLNSTLVDSYFRQFNGHTQVNASDLRSLRYPNRDVLGLLGSVVEPNDFPDQTSIDELVERTIRTMTDIDSKDPVKAQNRLKEAASILSALGFPKAQLNDRSALTLLALVDLRPAGDWTEAESPLVGITPIMEFCRDHYGRDYKPNTRETFRRQTMHQFVDFGLAVSNPDQPDRPINSPHFCYQIEPQALELLLLFGSSGWDDALSQYLQTVPTLRKRYARERSLTMVPVTLAGGVEVSLSPGDHSELIKSIVEEFAPRFTPGGTVLYLGETGSKLGHYDEEAFRRLNVVLDSHGKMPDVVIEYGDKNWLVLVEAVTSHGPVDGKRRDELANLFSSSTAGLVFVTAFPSRPIMKEYLAEISWETEVWVSSAPSHLIHFNGERFLGPYNS